MAKQQKGDSETADGRIWAVTTRLPWGWRRLLVSHVVNRDTTVQDWVKDAIQKKYSTESHGESLDDPENIAPSTADPPRPRS